MKKSIIAILMISILSILLIFGLTGCGFGWCCYDTNGRHDITIQFEQHTEPLNIVVIKEDN